MRRSLRFGTRWIVHWEAPAGTTQDNRNTTVTIKIGRNRLLMFIVDSSRDLCPSSALAELPLLLRVSRARGGISWLDMGFKNSPSRGVIFEMADTNLTA